MSGDITKVEVLGVVVEVVCPQCAGKGVCDVVTENGMPMNCPRCRGAREVCMTLPIAEIAKAIRAVPT